MNKIKKLYAVLNLFRAFPVFILWLKYKEVLKLDAERYLVFTPYKKVSFMMFFYALIKLKPFRSVLYMRTKKDFVFSALSKLFIRPLDSIELVSNRIEPGLLLLHNIGCVINVRSAGKNFTVAHGATVGLGNSDESGNRSPIIGENVWIATNAVVFGPINIGNNVKIGAGCVLNKSVPDNCTVVGNPARIVKRDGVKCDELL